MTRFFYAKSRGSGRLRAWCDPFAAYTRVHGDVAFAPLWLNGHDQQQLAPVHSTQKQIHVYTAAYICIYMAYLPS